MSFREIGDLTAKEIAMAAYAKQEQQKDFFRMMAWIAYNDSALTGVAVNDPRKFPGPEEVFPNLFEKKGQQDWWVMKEQVENYAKAKNKDLT